MHFAYDMDAIDENCNMPELMEPRLALFTLSEAHELLEVLRHFSDAKHPWGAFARHLAMEVAARVPSAD